MRDDLARIVEYRQQRLECCFNCKHGYDTPDNDYHNAGLTCRRLGSTVCAQCKDPIYEDVHPLGVCKLYTPYTVST